MCISYFNVVSLFTNVPLSKTIDLITNCLCVNEYANNIPLPKENFRKLMYMTTQGIFIDNGKFYQQLHCKYCWVPLTQNVWVPFLGIKAKTLHYILWVKSSQIIE